MKHSKHNTAANRPLVIQLVVLTVAMFGFGFLLVPIYDIFCDILGIGGKPDNTAAIVTSESIDQDRLITVEFIATLNEYAPWEFSPAVVSMEVHPGKLYRTSYFAKNLTDRHLTGQAVPSVAPSQVARYFKKTECFCFTSQEFEPNGSKDMALQFMVNPDIPDHIDRLTLSYTFFIQQQVALENSRTEG